MAVLLLLLPVEMGSCGGQAEDVRRRLGRDELELIVGGMWCHCVIKHVNEALPFT